MPRILPIPLFVPNKTKLQWKTASAGFSGPKPFVDLVDNSSNYTAIRSGIQSLITNDIYSFFEPKIYWYRIVNKSTSYAGFLCGLPTQECAHPLLTTHEHVLDKRVQLFSDYLTTTQVQAEPILALHENTDFTASFESSIYKRPCTISFSLNNEEHELWELDAQETKVIQAFAKNEEQFHLADGHHRLAGSLDYASKQTLATAVFSFVVAKNQLQNDRFVWAIKQLPKNISALDIEKLVGNEDKPNAEKSIGFLLGEKTHLIQFPKSTNAARFLFENILGFSTHDDINLSEYIDYFPPTKYNADRFLGSAQPYMAKFFYTPLSVDDIIQTAKAQEKLPPKSTYLHPKLPTGLFITPMHSFELL